MRSRKEIEEDAHKALATVKDNHFVLDYTPERKLAHLQLEALLDIRDLLAQQDTRPAVTYPESPPPPEVKS